MSGPAFVQSVEDGGGSDEGWSSVKRSRGRGFTGTRLSRGEVRCYFHSAMSPARSAGFQLLSS